MKRVMRVCLLVVTLVVLTAAVAAAQSGPLYNFLGTNREHTASRVSWSEGAAERPAFGDLGPMLNSQRIVNPTLANPNLYLMHNFFGVTVTGGNVPAQSAIGGFIRSTGTHSNAGGKDVTAISGHVRVEGGSTARGYAGWDSAWNFSQGGQAIGRETDAVNATNKPAPHNLGPGATTGLAIAGLIDGPASLYNTYGLLFQSAQGVRSAFRTGIAFEQDAVVPHGSAIHIPNETWVSGLNPEGNNATRMIAVDGLNNIRIRVPQGRVVMFDSGDGFPLVTINENGRVIAKDGVDVGSGWVLKGYPDGVYLENGSQHIKLGP